MKSLFVFLFFSSLTLFAKEVSLFEIYSHAKEYNPTLKSVYNEYKITQEKQNESKSTLLPNIVFNGTYNSNFNSETSNNSYENNPSSFTDKSYELRVTQAIINGKNTSNFSASKIKSQIAKLQYQLSSQNLILEVSKTYLELYTLFDKHTLAQKKLQTLKQQKEHIEKRYQLGDATIQDLSKTKSKFFLAQSEEKELFFEITIKKAKLYELTGVDLKDDTLSLISKNNLNIINKELSSYIQKAQENNIQSKMNTLNVEYSKQSVKANKGAFAPVVNLIGSKSYYRTDKSINAESHYKKQNYIGLQLSAALYEGGKKFAQLNQAKQEQLKIKNELASWQNQLQYEITKEYMQLKTTYSQIDSLNFALQAAKTSMDAAKVGFNIGTRTHYEVLETIEEYYFIKSNLSDIISKYILSSLTLKKLTGELSIEDLKIK